MRSIPDDSESEAFGLRYLTSKHRRVLSVGISTAGYAEIRMALDSPNRAIVATTLDERGLDYSKQLFQRYAVSSQIEATFEDISGTLPYDDGSFDFVYARLSLHYLPEKDLEVALGNIYRVIKPGGGFYLVVRSFDWESEIPQSTYDLSTKMTTYPSFDRSGRIIKQTSRHLHSVGSIKAYVRNTGFRLIDVTLIQETIYSGYERVPARKNSLPAHLIALYCER